VKGGVCGKFQAAAEDVIFGLARGSPVDRVGGEQVASRGTGRTQGGKSSEFMNRGAASLDDRQGGRFPVFDYERVGADPDRKWRAEEWRGTLGKRKDAKKERWGPNVGKMRKEERKILVRRDRRVGWHPKRRRSN